MKPKVKRGMASKTKVDRSLSVLGAITIASGMTMIISTFLLWMSGRTQRGFPFESTGWDTMIRGLGLKPELGLGFRVIEWFDGAVFFSGLFSLVLGALLIFAGAMIIKKKSAVGCMLGLSFGLLATCLAATDILMLYTRIGAIKVGTIVGPLGISVSAGIGLWFFIAAGGCAVLTSIICLWKCVKGRHDPRRVDSGQIPASA